MPMVDFVPAAGPRKLGTTEIYEAVSMANRIPRSRQYVFTPDPVPDYLADAFAALVLVLHTDQVMSLEGVS